MRREAIPPKLAEEGGLMAEALVDDLLALPGIELSLLRDGRLPLPRQDSRIQTLSVSADADFQALWLDAIEGCDAVWPIAPETSGILEQLCWDVESAGRPLLTSPAAAVRLAASKSATLRRLEAHGLAVVPTQALSRPFKPASSQAIVIKPDDGVGCEGIRIFREPRHFQAPAETEGWIVQPLLEGESLSLSVLFAHGKARLLSGNRQLIEPSADGFILKGCQVNALADADGRWQSLAEAVAQAMPELWGYVGIDLILGPEGPVILEINPRLTTSYAGLREATGTNPAAWVLELWRTGLLPPPRSHTGRAVDILLEKPDGD